MYSYTYYAHGFTESTPTFEGYVLLLQVEWENGKVVNKKYIN
jgi:hypothetical protein